ncbi:MAG: HD domain-containing phosphohydrolase [bacterium]
MQKTKDESNEVVDRELVREKGPRPETETIPSGIGSREDGSSRKTHSAAQVSQADIAALTGYESSCAEIEKPSVSAMRSSRRSLASQMMEVNKEIWLIFSITLLAAALNYLVTSHQVILGFYTLPTVFSAFYLGRRHAVLTAVASSFLVGLMAYFNPQILAIGGQNGLINERWFELFSWGGMLVLTAYAMGTLHARHLQRTAELRETYEGVLMILRQFISNDKYTENHSYRVSVYAVTIATYLNLRPDTIELVRAAALLHDIGKLEISRKLLHTASSLNGDEMASMSTHTRKGAAILKPVGSSLGKILPIILAHHDNFDGSGKDEGVGRTIPLEARVIAVADVYDALTSDRPYRKAMSTFEARQVIEKGCGKEFDPAVVRAFLESFQDGVLEVPEIFI